MGVPRPCAASLGRLHAGCQPRGTRGLGLEGTALYNCGRIHLIGLDQVHGANPALEGRATW